ncbi:MAG: FG-GAP repeat protein, partial [Patescibacteria group bacterium]
MNLKQKTKKLLRILLYSAKNPKNFWRALPLWGKRVVVILFIASVGFSSARYYSYWKNNRTLADDVKKFGTAGEQVISDIKAMPAVAMAEEKDAYTLKDDMQDGLKIETHGNGDGLQIDEKQPESKNEINVKLPKDYTKPIEVKLDGQRTILIADNTADKFSAQLLVNKIDSQSSQSSTLGAPKVKLSAQTEKDYLKYSSGRKSAYYAYQKDQAVGERKLKNWIVYQKGSGQEAESYTFQNAKLKLDEQGQVQVFFDDGKDEKNQQAVANVDPGLMERARQAILKDSGQDITEQGGQKPDFTIPQAYYVGKNGERKTVDWKIEDGKTLKLEFSVPADQYPIALDPTLQFTAPGSSNSASTISGEVTNNYFGNSLAAGDFNNDGKTDLAVGAYGYTSATGRAYIFYDDAAFPTAAASADAIITGENTGDQFGYSLAAGDFNNDGKTDLAVGAYGYATNTG